ncbi:exodeoxyribonuclease VII small subunit [Glutamicibacter halophytocola]
MTAQIPEDIAKLSYEQAREELLTVVNQLETGGVALEASLALWERGEALAAHCENWLNGVSRAPGAGPRQAGRRRLGIILIG